MSLQGNFLGTKANDGTAWGFGLNSNGQIGDGTISNRSSPVSVVGGHSFSLIVPGNGTSFALKADGSAWAWGNAGFGQLGNNQTAVSASSPVSVVGGHAFIVLSSNADSRGGGLSLKSDGSAWTWGSVSNGVSGDNVASSGRSSPVSVVGGHSFAAISGGDNFVISLKNSDGSAWTWGLNSSGQLGNNVDLVNYSSPISVVGGHSFAAVAAGAAHAMALKSSNGTVWGWGVNAAGQLADGATVSNKSSPISVVGGFSFNLISAGGSHSLAVKSSDGSAWAWGLNASGQVGDGQNASNRSSPVSVVGNHSFVKIFGAAVNSYALKADGSVWAWGSRTNGAIGNNTDIQTSSPGKVVGGHTFAGVAGGGSFAVAVKSSDGSAWAWGLNSSGQLGNNVDNNNRSSPVSVVGGFSFAAISTGAVHTIALKSSDGSAWGWGLQSTANGGTTLLGDNTNIARSSPVSVVGGHSFAAVSAGGSHSLAVKSSDGTVWAWGFQGTSPAFTVALGDNTGQSRSSPVSVVGGHSFTLISAGGSHSLAVKGVDGTAWAWGGPHIGTQGELGDNTQTVRSSPVSVVGGHSFAAISAGNGFSIALKSNNGSAWAWGVPSSGQVGDGAAGTQRISPVSVVGSHSFNAISTSASASHSLGLKSINGSAWAWGSNANGQLGDATLNNRSSPISVVGGHSFTNVQAGSNDSYGLKADGSVWAWGARANGALGNNTDTFIASPVQIVVGTNLKKILGVPYAGFPYNNIGSTAATIPFSKKVAGQTTANMKKLGGVTP